MNDHCYSPGERAILRKLDALTREIRKMDAAGEAVKQELEALDEDVAADNAVVVQAAEAIQASGEKFTELKGLLEKQATGALSDEEAQTLSTLAGEVDASLKTADTELAAHVKTLGEDTAAA
jgi:hypothetical protein